MSQSETVIPITLAERENANAQSRRSGPITGASFKGSEHIFEDSKQGGTGRKWACCGLGRALWRLLSKTNLSIWIIVGAVAGILLGHYAPDVAVTLKPLGTIFIYMISCLIVPLIFSSLVVGIAAHGEDLAAVGRLAVKSLVYFEILSTIALILGLIMVNLTKPGKGASIDGVDTSGVPDGAGQITWEGELYNIIPESFFAAAVENTVLQIVFCAIMFSVALAKLKTKKYKVLWLNYLKGLQEIMFGVAHLIMNYAPFAVCFSVGATIGANGIGVLASLGKLVGVVYGTLVIFVVCVLYPVTLIAKIPTLDFIKHIYQCIILAFMTASSESVLPNAMESLDKFGVPEKIYGFVLPAGYSFNLDGTSLHLTVAAIFCAQAANVELSYGTQIVMLLTLMLTSKGVAAVPRVSIVLLSATIVQYNIPKEALGLLLGVDAFLDMARTSVNVLGNCVAAVVMARWEGVYPAWGCWENMKAKREEALSEDEVLSAVEDDHLLSRDTSTLSYKV